MMAQSLPLKKFKISLRIKINVGINILSLESENTAIGQENPTGLKRVM
jgi:hypothetical protein